MAAERGEPGRNRTPEDRLTGLLNGISRFMFHHRHPMVQDQVLQMLAANGPMTQKEIQEQLNIRAGSCSELISKLEAKNHITRERDESDRRRVVIRLTERGEHEQRFVSAAQPEHPFDVLSPDEQAQLIQLLKKVLDNWTGREEKP